MEVCVKCMKMSTSEHKRCCLGTCGTPIHVNLPVSSHGIVVWASNGNRSLCTQCRSVCRQPLGAADWPVSGLLVPRDYTGSLLENQPLQSPFWTIARHCDHPRATDKPRDYPRPSAGQCVSPAAGVLSALALGNFSFPVQERQVGQNGLTLGPTERWESSHHPDHKSPSHHRTNKASDGLQSWGKTAAGTESSYILTYWL